MFSLFEGKVTRIHRNVRHAKRIRRFLEERVGGGWFQLDLRRHLLQHHLLVVDACGLLFVFSFVLLRVCAAFTIVNNFTGQRDHRQSESEQGCYEHSTWTLDKKFLKIFTVRWKSIKETSNRIVVIISSNLTKISLRETLLVLYAHEKIASEATRDPIRSETISSMRKGYFC